MEDLAITVFICFELVIILHKLVNLLLLKYHTTSTIDTAKYYVSVKRDIMYYVRYCIICHAWFIEYFIAVEGGIAIQENHVTDTMAFYLSEEETHKTHTTDLNAPGQNIGRPPLK